MGDPIKNALVVVENGKIVAVTPGVDAPDGVLTAKAVTAGMVDASSRMNSGRTSVEESREVTPASSVRYGIDLFDTRWDQLVSTGVTTAFVAPRNANVVAPVAWLIGSLT